MSIACATFLRNKRAKTVYLFRGESPAGQSSGLLKPHEEKREVVLPGHGKILALLLAAGIVLSLAGAGCKIKGEQLPLDTRCAPVEPGAVAADFTPSHKPYIETSYKIGSLDTIELAVAEHPEFYGLLRVNSDGTIVLPTLEEKVHIAGLNMSQAEARIWDVISPYVVGKPPLKVSVKRSRSRFFIALGAVRRTGRYFMGLEDVTVRDALLAVNLWGHGAKKDKVYVITPDTEGKPTYVVVNGGDIVMGDLSENIVLRPGDIVYVPTTLYFKINRVLDEILWQAGRVQDVETDTLKYGRSVGREGYGSLPSED